MYAKEIPLCASPAGDDHRRLYRCFFALDFVEDRSANRCSVCRRAMTKLLLSP